MLAHVPEFLAARLGQRIGGIVVGHGGGPAAHVMGLPGIQPGDLVAGAAGVRHPEAGIAAPGLVLEPEDDAADVVELEYFILRSAANLGGEAPVADDHP